MNMDNAKKIMQMPLNVGKIKLLHSVIFTPSYCLKITTFHNYTHADARQIQYLSPPKKKKKVLVCFKRNDIFCIACSYLITLGLV